MKKFLITTMIAFVMLMPGFAYAESVSIDDETILLEDDYYFETVIKDEPTVSSNTIKNDIMRKSSSKTATKSKTTYCKNSSGNVMWYVKVTGTFTCGNGSARCTKSTCTAKSNNKTWKVSNRSSSKRGNKASATATGTHYMNGVKMESITRTVTITCSPSGSFS